MIEFGGGEAQGYFLRRNNTLYDCTPPFSINFWQWRSIGILLDKDPVRLFPAIQV